MPRIALTTEEWLNTVPEDHKVKFDYSKSHYKATKLPVNIICRKCNTEFKQRPDVHSRGSGCKICAGKYLLGRAQRLTKENFIERSREVGGEQYDYSHVAYKNNYTKVKLICNVEGHGSFEMTPHHRMIGQHCPKCAEIQRVNNLTKTQDEFIEQCLSREAPKVSFENAVYVGANIKTEFTCTEHGPFFASPSNFLRGHGCPSCAASGYSHARPGRFYVLSDGATTKVGVTHRDPKKRADAVFRTGGPQMNVITSLYFEDGSIPTKIESACLKYLKARYEQVTQVFDGYTECFLDVDVKDLLNFITPIAALPETI